MSDTQIPPVVFTTIGVVEKEGQYFLSQKDLLLLLREHEIRLCKYLMEESIQNEAMSSFYNGGNAAVHLFSGQICRAIKEFKISPKTI